MIIRYKCLECDFEGEVGSINRKVKCPSCGTINDFSLIDEQPPINHR